MSEPTVEVDATQTLDLAAAAVVDNLVFPVGATGEDAKHTFAVVRIDPDSLNDLITTHGAVIQVRRSGGLTRTWQTTARMALYVYALGYTDAWAAQDAIEAVIGGTWRPNTQPGDGGIRIDSWRNESAATEQPYPGLTVLSSNWRVSTRHMPA